MQTTIFFYLIIFLKIQTKQKMQTKKKLTQDVLFFFFKTVWTFLFENICVCCQMLTKTLIGVTDVTCGGFGSFVQFTFLNH